MENKDKNSHISLYDDHKSTIKTHGDNMSDLTYLDEQDVSDTSFHTKTGRAKEFFDINSVKLEPEVKAQFITILNALDSPEELVEILKKYKPINKSMEAYLANKTKSWKVRRYKNAVYYGEVYNGKRHGKGIILYENFSLYEGDWDNNAKHGKGLEMTALGAIYEGDYKNGKPEGNGTFIWPNGERYEGDWKHGNKHGSGVWKGIKGESYVGEWVMGKQEGHGVFTWRNGDKYEGEFVNFLKHGQGKETFSSGEYYVGTYSNGKPNGYGEYSWPDGRQYKGNFFNGFRHGKGIWKEESAKGDMYEGEWENNKKCGYGMYQWKTGNHYKGHYFDDLREGYGEMYWTDGSYYKGMWHKGYMHGQGTLTMPENEKLEGTFKNGKFMGNGETTETESDKKSLIRDSSSGAAKKSSKKFLLNKTGFDETPNFNKSHDISIISDIGSKQSSIERKVNNPRSEAKLPYIRPPRHQSNKDRASSYGINSKNDDSSYDYGNSSFAKETKYSRGFSRSRANDSDQSRISRGVSREKTPQIRRFNRNYEEQNTTKQSQFTNNRVSNGENGFLTRKELARWDLMKEKLGIYAKHYDNLNDPVVCEKIKKLLYPNVWYPTDSSKLPRGRSTAGNYVSIFCAIYNKHV